MSFMGFFNNSKAIKAILFAVIVLGFYVLYSRNLVESFYLDTDFSRDMFEVLKIAKGNISLLGPMLSFGGLYTGPWYYYTFVPVLFISRFSPESILLWNAFLFAGSIGLTFLFLAKQLSILKSLLVSCTIAISSMFFLAARHPGNASTYLPILLIFIVLIFQRKKRKNELLFMGILGGLVITFHPISAVAVLFLVLYYVFSSHQKIEKKWFLIGFFVPFLPFVMFELTHGFIQSKAILLSSQFNKFFSETPIKGEFLSGTLLENAVFLLKRSGHLLFHPYVVYSIIILAFLSLKKNKKDHLVFSLGCFLFTISCMLLFPSKYEPHYLYPIMLYVLFSVLMLIASGRYWCFLFIPLIIQFVILLRIPLTVSNRSVSAIEERVEKIIDLNLVKKDEKVNVISITEHGHFVPVGNEYRYYLFKNGFALQDQHHYNDSEILLLISEVPDFQIKNLNIWETQEFGLQYLSNHQRIELDGVHIYIAKKTNE